MWWTSGAVGRIFALFALLFPVALGGASLRDGGAAVLTPQQAEEFFRRAGEAVTPADAELALCIDGVPVRIVATDGNFSLAFAGRTVPIGGDTDPLQPLDDALALAPFDLLCPFFRWDVVCYEGPGTALGRAVQRFSASSPTGWTVRVALDVKYLYPLCWDLHGTNGELVRRFRLRSIVKDADGGWGMGRAQISIPAAGQTVTIVPDRR